MLFLFRSAPEVEKRIHSKLFRNFLEEPGYKRAGLHYCIKSTTKQNERKEEIQKAMHGKNEEKLGAKL